MTIQKLPPGGVVHTSDAAPLTTKTTQAAPIATVTSETTAETGGSSSGRELPTPTASPEWIAAHAKGAAPGAQMSSVSVRFPPMSSSKSFHDNLSIAIGAAQASLGSHGATLSPTDALALFQVTKELGISPKELKDAERITAAFTARQDPNAPILAELTSKIRTAYADQGFLKTLVARVTDLGKKDALPSLTAEAKAATDPSRTGEWFGAHLGAAQESAPSEAPKAVGEGAAAKKYVMCPVIGSAIEEGAVKVDEDGNISLKDFDDFMKDRLNITPARAGVTVGTGFIGNHASDALQVASGKFNIAHLAGSVLDHRHHGDTGILQDGEFHEDKFVELCAHSTDGKTLCVADFAKAINDQLARDGGFVTRTKGASEDIFEMAALINTFGYVDDKGDRRISFETMRNLYQHRKLPAPEELHGRPATGIPGHVATMAQIGVEMAKDAFKGRGEP